MKTCAKVFRTRENSAAVGPVPSRSLTESSRSSCSLSAPEGVVRRLEQGRDAGFHRCGRPRRHAEECLRDEPIEHQSLDGDVVEGTYLRQALPGRDGGPVGRERFFEPLLFARLTANVERLGHGAAGQQEHREHPQRPRRGPSRVS